MLVRRVIFGPPGVPPSRVWLAAPAIDRTTAKMEALPHRDVTGVPDAQKRILHLIRPPASTVLQSESMSMIRNFADPSFDGRARLPWAPKAVEPLARALIPNDRPVGRDWAFTSCG